MGKARTRFGVLLAVLAVVSNACGASTAITNSPSGAPGASRIAPTSASTSAMPSSTRAVLPSASVEPTASATASSPSPSASPSAVIHLNEAIRTIGPNGRIVFYRRDDGWPAPAFVIDPDGSNEAALTDRGSVPGLWSPDFRTLAVNAWVKDPSPAADAEAEWIRPALVAATGSEPRVLNGSADRKMHLLPIGWSAGGKRLFV